MSPLNRCVRMMLGCAAIAMLITVHPVHVRADAPVESEGTRFGMYIPANHDALHDAARMDAAVEMIVDNGFNLIVPQVRALGEVYYVSETEALAPSVRPGLSDPLGALIEKVKARNPKAAVMPSLQLLTVYSYYDALGEEPRGVLKAHPDWVLVNVQGKIEDADRRRYLDPALPAVQKWLIETVREVAARYDVPAVIVEDLMSPPPAGEWGFSPATLRLYSQETGASGRPAPGDREWLQWRGEKMTQLAAALRDAVHEARPGTRLILDVECMGPAPVSEADFPNTSPWRDHAQNWLQWLKDGTADVIVLNNLRKDLAAAEGQAWVEFAAAADDQPRRAALGMNVAGYLNFATGVAGQMIMAQDNGVTLLVLHSLRKPVKDNEESLFRLLRESVFNRPRVFKPSGIVFTPPETPQAVQESPTTPTAAIAATPAPETSGEEGESSPPVASAAPPKSEVEPSPEPAGAAPTAVQTPAAAATPTTDFVVPGTGATPTPSPAPSPTPAVERRLPTEVKQDTLYLKNGQIIRGRFIDELEGKIIFEQESGLQLNIPVQQVEKIERAVR
ncbi:MAG: hypothetical protein Kow0059_06530 [Candidatus Sumerlaeia bacterium]